MAKVVALAALIVAPLTSCIVTGRLSERPRARMILTGGPNQSMIYAIATTEGVVLVDLGWWGASDALRTGLLGLERRPADVSTVLLTHAHRDHIAAWPDVAQATFYLGAAEIDEFHGAAEYQGWVPKYSDRLIPPGLPERGDVLTVGITVDTAFVVGADTIRAFVMPGHTEGSVAYLVRGVLFAGDAISHSILSGMRLARTAFSDDVAQARRSAIRLFRQLESHDVEMVCTAHARCRDFDDALIRETLRP